MAIDSTNLVVALKAFSRSNPLPLDSSEIYDNLASAQTYAESAKAYAGQTIKALVDGQYKTYVLNPKAEGTGFDLTEVGGSDIDPSKVKAYVQVVTALPTEGQEQGVVYINTTDNKGYIYNGTDFQVVFEQIDGLESSIAEINTKLDTIQGTGDGSIAKALEDAKAYTNETKTALQSEIAQAVATAEHLKRAIVDALPDAADADANTIYMVAKTGGSGDQQYDEFMLINGAFEKIGDSTVDLTDYATKTEVATAKSEAVAEATATAATDATTKADAAQAAAIAAAATDAQTKADAAQAAAIADAEGKIDAAKTEANTYADTKATETLDAAKAYTDAQLQPVVTNLNTKVDQAAVDTAIAAKVGDISEGTTVKQYIDTAVGSGGTASAEAIAEAKQQAIQAAQEYTDSALTITEF